MSVCSWGFNSPHSHQQLKGWNRKVPALLLCPGKRRFSSCDGLEGGLGLETYGPTFVAENVPVPASIVGRSSQARIRCPGSRFRAIFANRDNFCCPGINVNRFMRKPGQRANSRIGLIPPIPSARRYELRKPECPGSRKQAEIADRDSGFCPGRQVKRLTYEPGQIQIREKPMK